MALVRTSVVAAFVALHASSAIAQVSAAGTTLIIPVVASTATYTSEVMIQDFSSTSRQIAMTFYEALTSAAPGPKTCTPITLAADGAVTIVLATQCPLTAASHHGFVVLQDASVPPTNLFTAFARTENFAHIGFAVDGIPIGHIGGGEDSAAVIGVKRQAATASGPAFQTNCFVGTLDDAVNYSINVWAPGGPFTISDTLQPFQMRRYLDIFASAGAPTGDYTNVPVEFVQTNNPPSGTLLAFCTVQDNASFGADFRLAKNQDGADNSMVRQMCFAAVWSSQTCTDTLQVGAPTITAAANKNRWLTLVRAPDTVVCSIMGPRKADLELRIGRFVSGIFVVEAGGNDQQSFVYATGPRSAIANGWHVGHFLEVGFREGGAATFPIAYGIFCRSGNGMATLINYGAPPDDF